MVNVGDPIKADFGWGSILISGPYPVWESILFVKPSHNFESYIILARGNILSPKTL
jgi:hypothetical protein